MKYAIIDPHNSIVLALHETRSQAAADSQKKPQSLTWRGGVCEVVPHRIVWDAEHVLRVDDIHSPLAFDRIDRESRIYKHECFEETLSFAEDLGWIDTYLAFEDDGWTDTLADACEEEAIEWIESKGFTVIYPKD